MGVKEAVLERKAETAPTGANLPRRIATLAVLLVVFAWNWWTGHMGIFAFDQSMMFDGAWRIYAGQVPFRDFYMAFTPLSFALQAAMFHVTGVSWSSLVFSACVASMVAALSTIRITKLLAGHEVGPWLPRAAGLVVGLGFQSVFGTLWIENTGFLFSILGLQAVAESTVRQGWLKALFLSSAGACVTLAFLCKQNVGALTGVLLLSVAAAANATSILRLMRGLAWWAAGMMASALGFYGWLVAWSSPAKFFHHAIEIPAQVGSGRVHLSALLNPADLLTTVSGASSWCSGSAILAAACTAGFYLGDSRFRFRFHREARLRACFAACLCLPAVQNLFQMTTLNGPANILFLGGLSVAVSAGLFLQLAGELGIIQTRTYLAISGVAALCLAFEMTNAARTRIEHDVFPPKARVERLLRSPGLSHVRWIKPQMKAAQGSMAISADDVDGVTEWLQAERKPFLLLGEHSFLYGLSGQRPSQPFLYFQDHHYYTEAEAKRLDMDLLRAIESGQIRTVVVERSTFFPSIPPVTLQWVQTHLHKVAEFGAFAVFTKD